MWRPTGPVTALLLSLAWSMSQPGEGTAQAAEQLAANERVAEALEVVEVWLDAQIAYEQIPSLSATIVHDQELVWSRAMGMAHPERGVEATPETLYSICSISKLFTAISAMQLRDRGLLSLRDPVDQHLSWLDLRQRHQASAPITVEGLLTHSAGLPRESDHPYWTGPDFPFPTREEIIERLSDQETLYPAWRYFQYSNLGLSLVGELVAALSGQSYHQYVRKNILDPLGMDDTYSEIPTEHRDGRLATGYSSLTRDGSRDPVAFFQARGIAPAAGFASTPEDLARFASWQFRLLDGDAPEEVLTGHTLAEMQRVHYVDPEWETYWGLGFNISRRNGKTFVGHGGSCPGFRSQLGLQPDDRIAVVAMTNAMADAGSLAGGMYELVAEAIAAATAEDDAGDAEDDVVTSPEDEGPELDPYIGTYEAQPWGGETAVVRWKGSLAVLPLPAENPRQRLTELRHDDGDVFLRVRDDGEPGETIVFERDADGDVIGFRRHGQLSRRIR